MFKKLAILSGIISISKLILGMSLVWCLIYNILYFTSYTLIQVDNIIVKQYSGDYSYNSLIATGISFVVLIIILIVAFFIQVKEIRKQRNNILSTMSEDSKEFFGKDFNF